MSASVGVVMPVRDGSEFIAEALRSVLVQTHPVAQVVVVDDASRDDTVAQVLATAAGDTRVTVVDGGGNGVAHATNLGFDLLETTYVAIQHQDDRWHPDKTARQLAVFGPQAAFVGCRQRYLGRTGRVMGRTPYGHLTDEQLRDVRAGRYAPCLPSALLLRTQDAVRVRFPEDVMPSDLDFVRRLAREGEVVMIDDCLCDYRIHPGASTLAKYADARRTPDFLAARDAARAQGKDLTRAEFERAHPLTVDQRRRYAAGLWGRRAATHALSEEYVRAASAGVLAAACAPVTTARSLTRLLPRGPRAS